MGADSTFAYNYENARGDLAEATPEIGHPRSSSVIPQLRSNAMIPGPMPEPRTSQEARVKMGELSKTINRLPNTIRKWEREGKLPKKLMPKRDEEGRRYWTPAQVEGIVKWMAKLDMRPGRTITDPSREADHITNLRRPKFLNGHHIRSAREMAANGKSMAQITNRIFPRTKYATEEAFEKALRRAARLDGFTLPRRPPAIKRERKRKRRKSAA